MHHFTKVILVIFCVSNAMSQDTVPHTFKPGTPAKAAEVNANFQTVMQKANDAEIKADAAKAKADANASEMEKVKEDVATLDRGGSPGLEAVESDIESLDSRVTALEGSGGGSGSGVVDPREISFDYTAKTAPIGSIVQIGGAEHRLVKFPFIDMFTGERYTIQYATLDPLFSWSQVDSGLFDVDFSIARCTIDSYPARALLDILRSADISSGGKASSFLHSYFRLFIKVGNTHLKWRDLALPFNSRQEVDIADEDYDISDDLSYDEMIVLDRERIQAYVSDLVSYIKIERVSK